MTRKCTEIITIMQLLVAKSINYVVGILRRFEIFLTAVAGTSAPSLWLRVRGELAPSGKPEHFCH